MIKVIISDFSRTLLNPTDESYAGGLNALHESLKDNVDYNIWEHYRLNQDLLSFYQKINNRVDIYLFTTKFIQEWPPLKDKLDGIFKEVFTVAKLGLKKNNPNSYQNIAKKIGFNPNEILFIDDSQANLDAAKDAGVVVVKFKSEEQTIRDIENFLP